MTANSFGARWFDEDWNAQFDQPEWEEALTFFVDLMNSYGPPGYATNGFNENLSLFQQGRCGMWIDATVAASFRDQSGMTPPVAGQRGLRAGAERGRRREALQLALGLGARHPGPARSRRTRQSSSSNGATSEGLHRARGREGERGGWANVPHTRAARTSGSTRTPEYQEVPFAEMTLELDRCGADPTEPDRRSGAYTSGKIQFRRGSRNSRGIATEVSQEFAEVYAGQQTIAVASRNAQAADQ